ncbi:PP2C family protein-serine/threonine phosphatase [Streptosporangium sp. V21-05]|uniref:PP2C family protein-serine/threonine phosphatase n=1 Tax=Streptosporangium sp. V21-05 TaxID=3446115 RepID=UPI003F52C4BE
MTTAPNNRMITVAKATRPGTASPSGDAAVVCTLDDRTTAIAIVDGIGHSDRVAHVAALLAETAARVAARRGPLAGILTATELIADTGASEDPEPDAAAVVVTASVDADDVRIAWVGDCRAYALEDGQLQLLTVDHNLATQLEMCGYEGEVTRRAAQLLRTSIATASVATVSEAWTTSDLVVLTSDGVHDQVPHDMLEKLVLTRRDDPQALAEAIVAAARADADGHRDDATVVVLAMRPPAAAI